MKKKNRTLGRQAKQEEVTLFFRRGAIVIENVDDARESLEEYDEIMEAVKPVLEFAEEIRKAATGFVKTTNATTIQLENAYWRKQQRHSRFMVSTDADIPEGAPKGTKSVRSICQGKRIKLPGGRVIPLWNFVTRRVVDTEKLAEAERMGAVTQKELEKAFLETPGAVFIQRYEGVPPEDRE